MSTGALGSTQEPELTLPTADKEKQRHPTHGAANSRLDPQGTRRRSPPFAEHARVRITESQNSRGWKGPLWVI